MKHCLFPLILLLFVSYQVSALGVSINGHTNSFLLTANTSNSITLTCEVVNNTGNETLLWYRGKSQVDIKTENSVNSSSICIFPVTPQDNEVSFSCVLKSNTSISVSAMLDIKFDPILTGEDNVIVEIEKTAQLTCDFKANPQAAMSWRRNDNLVNMVSRYQQYLTSDSFQLTINKAEKKDAGLYTCMAFINGMNFTRSFNLDVADKKDVLPIEAIGAAVVVGALIILFAMFARREKIFKKCLKPHDNTSL
ncbi:transmembrane and immunoglobulin domain-containing 1 [Pelobates cultripes]|nr:transmembrane and immunoglobulin domain-containing 1 [Pelobates cultripes]